MRPALAVSDLCAELDMQALAARRILVRIGSGRLFLSPQAIALLLPPESPVRFEGLSAGRVHLRVSRGLFPLALELEPAVAPSGRLALRPQGLVGVLAGLFSGSLREVLGEKRGLHVVDGGIELDLDELLRPIGIQLPALR